MRCRPTLPQTAPRFIPAWAGNAETTRPAAASDSVHPRVGGECWAIWLQRRVSSGSSPRGRGMRRQRRIRTNAVRFIPAWAGNAAPYPQQGVAAAVHPRVGGECGKRHSEDDGHGGSSPRGRGMLKSQTSTPPPPRFIPAWAGNAATPRSTMNTRPVHPRVGGECVASARSDATPPVHPRVGGECFLLSEGSRTYDGSSPRGRGMLQRRDDVPAYDRFIPAWAGNASGASTHSPRRTVHPRVGGECVGKAFDVKSLRGSSPRGRGMLARLEPGRCPARFIPAWAGNAGCWAFGFGAASVHPRVGGECGAFLTRTVEQAGSSPRGRGMPAPPLPVRRPARFIPAWAGNAITQYSTHETPSVHPRVGGECGHRIHSVEHEAGSSPRGRGMRCRQRPAPPRPRFIPAWAGNA